MIFKSMSHRKINIRYTFKILRKREKIKID